MPFQALRSAIGSASSTPAAPSKQSPRHSVLLGLVRLTTLFVTVAASCHAFAFSDKYMAAADVLFDRGSAAVATEEREKLRRFADNVSEHMLEVVIAVGHAATDEADPLSISEQRATSTRFELIQLGFPPSRIYIEGKGATQPWDKDVTRQRRVEIEYIGTYPSDPKAPGASPLRTWHLEFMPGAKRSLGSTPVDQRSSVSPLQFLPFISDTALRQRFLKKYSVVTIGERYDELLKTLSTLSQPSEPSAESVAALMAFAFGTPFAKATFAKALEHVDTNNPEVRQFALRAWCGSYSQAPSKSILRQPAIQSMLSSLTPAADQVRWVECAAQRADPEMFRLLKSNGVNVSAQGPRGRTALHGMVASADLSAVKALLGEGPDPNVRDAEGRTALHDVRSASHRVMTPMPATTSTKLAIWNALIEAGADTSILDKNGKSPTL